MARGYSVSRSKSLRPTLRQKRQRSLSVALRKHDLTQRLSPASTEPRAPSSVHRGRTEQGKDAAVARTPSTQTRAHSHGSRTPVRSMSTMRRHLEAREAQLRSQERALGVYHTGDAEDNDALGERVGETIQRPDVMTKYKTVGRAVDEVLNVLSAACVAGANTTELCALGDRELLERLRCVFSKAKDSEGKRIARGLSYPTNISVNDTVCNHAPFRLEDGVRLRCDDVVKMHLGAHLDGYPVSAARTVVVPGCAVRAPPPITAAAAHTTGEHARPRDHAGDNEEEQKQQADSDNTAKEQHRTQTAAQAKAAVSVLTPTACDAIEASRVGLLGMMHMLRPGVVNADVTDFLARVGGNFGVQAIEGVLSHRTKRWVADGVDCIIGRRVMYETPQQDVAECTVGGFQVWTLDVAFTNADVYRTTLADDATTMYRRTPAEVRLDARVQNAEEVLREITDKHHCFPFHFNALSSPLRAKMGINVLVKNGVLDPLPCLRVKGGPHRVVARFSATVAVTHRRVTVLCGAPPELPMRFVDAVLQSHVTKLYDDVVAVLNTPLNFGMTQAPDAKQNGSANHKTRAQEEKVDNEEEEEGRRQAKKRVRRD